jgi:hypothetical protein
MNNNLPPSDNSSITSPIKSTKLEKYGGNKGFTSPTPHDQTASKAITDFENTYPTLSTSWKEIQQEQYELFAKKMLDYGLGNIALGTNLEDLEDVKLSLTGIWLRCNDKINRLKNLLKRDGKNYVEEESIIDSFIDISNYGIIAQLVIKNKWKK